MSTNFDKVGEFHETFEHPKLKHPDLTVFENNPKLVDLRVKLIEEEFNELKDAIKDKNMKEVADALTDILYVVYGAGHAFGIDLNQTFNLVHNSNMTKACSSEDEAKNTVEYIKNTQKNFNPDYKLAKTGDKWIVYDKNTGKILKNMNYKAVDLSYVNN